MKILHLIKDHQVIERSLGMFEEVFPNQNEVLIFGQTNSFKHLHKYADCQLVTHSNYKEIADNYDFSEIRYVIAHYLELGMADFIDLIPKSIHVSWEIYGYDLYDQFLQNEGFELYYTKPTIYPKYAFFEKNFGSLFNLALALKGYKYKTRRSIHKRFVSIANRIDSLGICCSGDKEILEKYANKTYPSFLFCNYSLHEVLGELWGHDFSDGADVLVGNSASYSNNHLYVLTFLKKLEKDFKILMPLSYGGTEKYKKDVLYAYNMAFPNRVNALLSYMPLHEYNNVFLGLNSMILSAWRQESIGTIFMGLYLGIRIYMSEKSPLYRSLKGMGFDIFTVEGSDLQLIDIPLSLDARKNNRELLLEQFNEERIKDNLRHHFVLN